MQQWISKRCRCSLWFVPAGVFVNGSFQCPQFIKLGKRFHARWAEFFVSGCGWQWVLEFVRVIYTFVYVSCESDSNIMFPSHRGGTHTHTAASATVTWLFAAAIGCSQSFLYPQHRQWASSSIRVRSCEWKNQAVHKEIEQIWVRLVISSNLAVLN